MKLVVFLLLSISTVLEWNSLVKADIFTSIAGMEILLETEKVVLAELQKRFDSLEEKSDDIRAELNHYKLIHEKAMKDVSKFVALPTNAFMLTKRLSIDYDELLEIISDSTIEQVFDTNNTKLYFPDNVDLNGTIQAIFRLQDVYDLDTHNFANGIINGVDYGNKMSASDCLTIGSQAYDNQDYYHAEMWVKESLKRVRDETYPTISGAQALYLLVNLANVAGKFPFAVELASKIMDLDSNDEKVPQYFDEWQTELVKLHEDSILKVDEYTLFKKVFLFSIVFSITQFNCVLYFSLRKRRTKKSTVQLAKEKRSRPQLNKQN